MSGRVCVIGSFMMDLVASAPRRPVPGETLVGTDFSIHRGGKGFNQAVAAVRAGARTSMVGLLGADDFGSDFRAALVTEGVDDTQVGVDGVAGTGVGLPVVEPDGQNSIVVVPRANLRVGVHHVRKAAAAIAAADVLLLQLELSVEVALAAARLARDAGTTVVLNPAPATALPDELLSCADVLVPNEVELAALAGAPTAGDVERVAQRLQRRWDTHLVVTRGALGVLVLMRGGATHEIAAVPVTAVDTVGAGDTFCGYLGAGLSNGDSLVDAATRANRAAGIAVTRRGSADSAPRREEVDALGDEYGVVATGGRS